MSSQLVFSDSENVLRFKPLGFMSWRSKDGGWAFSLLGFSIVRLHRELPVEWRFRDLIAGRGRFVSVMGFKMITARTRLENKIHAEIQSIPSGKENSRRKGNSVERKS